MKVKALTVPHANSSQVRHDVAQWCDNQTVISASSAVAIASWYQSPKGYGLAFNRFASFQEVEHTDLTEAILEEAGLVAREVTHPKGNDELTQEVLNLEALHSWVSLWVASREFNNMLIRNLTDEARSHIAASALVVAE